MLLSDVSQSIISALAPVSSANVAPVSASAAQSLLDEVDDAGSTALGLAMQPDVVRPASAETHTPSIADERVDEDEGWNW